MAKLRLAVNRPDSPHPQAQVERYLAEIFLEHPLAQPDMPSLVHEDAAGEVIAFLGVVPKAMVFQGRPVRLAIASKLAVSEAARGLAGAMLFKSFSQGPQDISVSDIANEAARKLFQASGGETLTSHSLVWRIPLRRIAATLLQLGRSPLARVARRAMRPLARVADYVKADYTRGPAGSVKSAPLRELLPQAAAWYPSWLRPRYSESDVDWSVGHVVRHARYGALQSLGIYDQDNALIGVAGYFAPSAGTGRVVCLLARAHRHALVLEHLCVHARARGLIALEGQSSPEWLDAVAWRDAALGFSGPYFVAASRDPDLRDAMRTGRLLLPRLDGEWCTAYF